MAKETDQEARLRLFLGEYERVCNRYSLTINNDKVFERYGVHSGTDFMPIMMRILKGSGINA